MDFIPVNEPLLDGNEKKYLCECIETGWVSSEGPFVSEFEKQMSQSVSRKYGIAVSNGTTALEIAARAIGIKEGDEVIMPTFTIISCAMAITKLGAKPILIDSNIDTWNMKVEDIEKKITNRTKAILVVHIYGLPVEMDEILRIAQKHDLKIIEDAAEMHGQKYKGRACGSFGDISTFSFYANKHITTGEGGMIVTDDEKLAERCRELRNLCFKKEVRYVHDELSDNCRFTNLQAAVGLAQLERLPEFVQRKKSMGKYYTDNLNGIEGINLPIIKTDYAENIYWVYGIVLDEDLHVNNREVQELLKAEGVGTRSFFWCMHEQPVYIGMGMFKNEKYANAEYLARKGFYIPSGLALTSQQMEKVVDAIKKVMKGLNEGKM